MTDVSELSNRQFLSFLKGIPIYIETLMIAETWEEVEQEIKFLNLEHTQEQMDYVKAKQWS